MSSPHTPRIDNKACEFLGQEKLQGSACNVCHLVDLNARNEETRLLCWAFFDTWNLNVNIIFFIILIKFFFHNGQLKIKFLLIIFGIFLLWLRTFNGFIYHVIGTSLVLCCQPNKNKLSMKYYSYLPSESL